MKKFFEEYGIPVRAEGNKPAPLNEEGKVWLVSSGAMEIYGIITRNGEPLGPRMFLFRAEAGQLLFHTAKGSKTAVTLLAIGLPGSEVLESDILKLEKKISSDSSLCDPFDAAINGWVSGLSTQAKGIMPRDCVELTAGEEIFVTGGRNVRPRSGVLWVAPLDGNAGFMSNRPLLQKGQGEHFIPLSSQTWLESYDDSQYFALDTRTFLRSESMWPALELFHAAVFDRIAVSWLENETEERRRLDLKNEKNETAFSDALTELASILSPGEPFSAPEREERDALLAACRIVGEKIGIVFRSPGTARNSFEDHLDAITRASRVWKRQVILKGEWWKKDNGPLLGFREQEKSPVALLPASARGYEVHDPVDGSRSRVTYETVNDLNPYAYAFYPPLPERALRGWDLLRIGTRGAASDVLTVLLMGAMGGLAGLAAPIITGIIFDSYIPDGARSQLMQMAIILFACAFAAAAFEVTKTIALIRIESKMDASVQSGIMGRLLSLPAPFFRSFTAGDLADRAMGINAIRQFASGVAVQSLMSGIFSLFYLALMFWYDVRLALAATGMAMAVMTVTCIGAYSLVQLQRSLSEVHGKISGMVLQFVTGISKIRLSGTEGRAFAVWAGKFGEQKRIAFKAGIISNMLASFNAAFPVLSLMVIFAWLAMGKTGPLTAGGFLAFNAAFAGFQVALLQMSSTFISILRVVPLYERAKPILENLPEVDSDKKSPGELTGDIELSHVSFRYSSDGPLVLDDISLHISPGEFIAFAGSSGSGKSTLLRLLLGFETPETGTIYYDGKDLSDFNIKEMRRQVGVVLQSGKIMAGDIFRNIIGSSSLTLDDAWEAARMAGLDADISRMPMGMHTVLSAGGGTLSGGQRQRLLIARAIVRRPRFVFFDEATSALDNTTQSLVTKSLEQLRATRVVIAHRLSTIIGADRIFVFEKGRIVQSGNYEHLITVGGPFAEFAKRQLI
jgi:NHLM bacteriocin system ABC transporter ATP-binding protein